MFEPTNDVWSYRDGIYSVHLDFSQLEVATSSLLLNIKRVLLWYAENKSASHLENMFGRLAHFLRFLKVNGVVDADILTAADLINYRSSIEASPSAWYFGSLSGLLKRWYRLGYPGVAEDAVLLLKQIRTKSNDKGVAVLTMDPLTGPYTSIELAGLQAALDSSFQQRSLDVEEYLLAWLFMLLGQRPVQYAAMKVCDVQSTSHADGTQTYTVMVPRAKQRGKGLRSHLKERVIIPHVGELLVRYAKEVERKFGRADAPLFPSRGSGKHAEGFQHHRTAQSLGDFLQRALDKLDVRSERTGKPINAAPIRFRRTLGTRAAEEGHAPLVIAELLDHSDTQNVGIYIAATPAIVERIDRATALQMAPLAQAFAGKLIDREEDATRANDPSSRIIDLRIDRSAKPMGSCGQFGFCGFSAPIACYTCASFEPWRDGPHEAVLAYLIARREQLLLAGDTRIAEVHDRTIFAVADVVQRCMAALEDKRG